MNRGSPVSKSAIHHRSRLRGGVAPFKWRAERLKALKRLIISIMGAYEVVAWEANGRFDCLSAGVANSAAELVKCSHYWSWKRTPGWRKS
jgi:hypothetical protein